MLNEGSVQRGRRGTGLTGSVRQREGNSVMSMRRTMFQQVTTAIGVAWVKANRGNWRKNHGTTALAVTQRNVRNDRTGNAQRQRGATNQATGESQCSNVVKATTIVTNERKGKYNRGTINQNR